MTELELRRFIASHRNKLDEEKGRLKSDTHKNSWSRTNLRSGDDAENDIPDRSSVANMQRNVSSRRKFASEYEINPNPRSDRRDLYTDGNDQTVQGRRYETGPDDRLRRKQWYEEAGVPQSYSRTSRWEDEERGLMQWAKVRDRVRSAQQRENLPPSLPTYEAQTGKDADKGPRSISAPVVTGIAAIGVTESEVEKRERQQRYAEELKAQIMAKNKEKVTFTDTSKGANEKGRLDANGGRGGTRQPPLRMTERQRDSEYGKSSNTEHSHCPDYRWPAPPNHRYPDPPDHRYPPSHDHLPPPPSLGRTHSPPRLHYYTPHDRHVHPEHGYGNHPYPLPYDYRSFFDQYAVPHWPPPFYPPQPYYPPPGFYHPPAPPKEGYGPGPVPGPVDGDAEDMGRHKPEDDTRSVGSKAPPQKSKSFYRSELKRQMEEKKANDERSKMAVVEVPEYNPWGKGGAGAPVRDERGKLVTDLRKMRKLNEEKLLKGSLTSPRGDKPASCNVDPTTATTEASPKKEDIMVSPSAQVPSNEQDQAYLEDYKESLKKQIEERQAAKKKEVEAKRLEDLKELERIKNEQQRIEENYKKEQELAKKKEVEARARNALLKKEAEEKRMLEATAHSQADRNKVSVEQENEKQRASWSLGHPLDATKGPFTSSSLSSSPPVPVLRHQSQADRHHVPSSPPPLQYLPSQSTQRVPSPPVPALRKKLERECNATVENNQEAPRPIQLQNPLLPQKSAVQQLKGLDTQPIPDITIQTSHVNRTESDSEKLMKDLSAIKKHLQKEHAKLASKMVPIHRTEGASAINGVPLSTRQELTNPVSVEYGRIELRGLDHQPPPLFPPPPPKSKNSNSRAPHQKPVAGSFYQEPEGLLLTSKSEEISEPTGLNQWTKPRARRQWNNLSSPSQLSVATFDIDAIAVQNEERQRRLEAILNGGVPKDPQATLQDFIDRTSSLQPKYKIQTSSELGNVGFKPATGLNPTQLTPPS